MCREHLSHHQDSRADAASAGRAARRREQLLAVGGLVPGIAHELASPLQVLADNTRFLEQGLEALLRLLRAQREALAASPPSAELAAGLAALEGELDLPYLVEQLPGACRSSLAGLLQLGDLAAGLGELARPDPEGSGEADLNRALLAVLATARNEYKYVAEVETELGPIPPVACHATALHVLLLALVTDVARVVAGAATSSGRRGRIRILTARAGDQVCLSVGGGGAGSAEAARLRLLGAGAAEAGGLDGRPGLAVARRLVAQQRGTLEVEDVEGLGAAFRLRLPIGGSAQPGDGGEADLAGWAP